MVSAGEKRIRSLTTGILLAASLPVFPGQAGGQQYPPEIPDARVEVFKSVEGVDLRLWILSPDRHKTSDRAPAMVFFFGGGFRSGSPIQFLSQANAFRSRGMVAILADYRVSDRHGTGPGRAVEDGKSAIRWVRTHAGELGIDPARIGAGGASSGGQLAASTATLPGFEAPGEDGSVSSKPDALVLLNPGLVFAPVEGLSNGLADLVPPADAPAQDLSPYHHVGANLVPTLVMHGSNDELVPLATVIAFCRRASDQGGRCEVEAYDGVGHGFFNRPPYRERTIQRAERFLESLGWLTTEGASR